jgi:hypothetical protein
VAYRPYRPARSPSGSSDEQPLFRVLVHQRLLQRWEALATEVGIESAQQFYDHVSQTPGQPPAINSTSFLKGKAANPTAAGFSRTIHYKISSAGRINYQYNAQFTGGRNGDAHGVVRIIAIDLGSH